MACGVNKIGGNDGNISGNTDTSGSMFFVWQAGIDGETWVSRLSLLAGASIIAIFPSRDEAVNYALQRGKADKKATLVAERRFSFASGDCNNLISECSWNKNNNQEENGNGNGTSCSCPEPVEPITSGLWKTEYNERVKFNSSFPIIGIIQTGVFLRDATTYKIIVSAMGGSITGDTLSKHNCLIPYFMDTATGELYELMDIDNFESMSLLFKGLFEFRWQESDEGNGETMYYANTLLDTSPGTISYSYALDADRKAALNDWNRNIAYVAGVANHPHFLPTGTEFELCFTQPRITNVPTLAPTCDAKVLLKVEALKMQESR